MSTTPDQEDANGPPRAWTELAEALRRYFARRVPEADVDDLLQDCYLRFSRGLPGLRDRERLAPWVFRIAHNLVVEHARRRQRAGVVRADSELVEREPDEADGQDLDKRIACWLAAMVERLPPKYAEVLRESELRRTPHRELAERLGLSVSGVKSRVQRGRELLRAALSACCRLEFDRRGRIRDYQQIAPRRCDC